MADRALVVIPTYDEAQNVRELIPQVLAQDARIDVLIVDDNSPDGTGAIADELAAANPRVHVLHRPGKQGLGTAYRTGFRWALERDYELILEMDADFSHDPEHLPEFLAAAEEADLVLGARYLDRRVTVVNWPVTRLLLSYSVGRELGFSDRAEIERIVARNGTQDYGLRSLIHEVVQSEAFCSP